MPKNDRDQPAINFSHDVHGNSHWRFTGPTFTVRPAALGQPAETFDEAVSDDAGRPWA